MLESIGKSIKKATDKIANSIFLDKKLLEEIIRDLQRSLIESDIDIKLVKNISEKIRQEALNERIKGIDKKEHLIKLLHDEIKKILGEYSPLKINSSQNRILLLGLYGAGKTTTIAKIGNWYSKRGKKVALIGLDVHRPAAKEQLIQLGEKNNLYVYTEKKEKDPIKIWKNFKKDKKFKEYEIILIDSAGRHDLDKQLIKELESLKKEINTTENILVLPADIGQAAKKQIEGFQKAVKISGTIITRMDSSAKGGGALSACVETNSGIYFITNGEKINDIEEFNPEKFLSRILGMGDLDTLIEKIKSITDKKEQEKISEKLKQGKLSLQDVVEQAKSMSSLGGLDKIKSMIPGFSKIEKKIPENMIENQEAKISKWEHIIKSMTEKEKENPEIIEKQTSRIKRIAKGSGVNNTDIRSLLKQYNLLKELTKSGKDIDMSSGLSQKQIQKLAKKFGKRMRI